MASVTPYLFFDGSCREALGFYQACVGGDLELTSYGQAQGDACKLGDADKIIHGTLRNGPLVLMASDRADAKPTRGDNVCLSLRVDSAPELERTFSALSEGGTVAMPLHDAFWGDRFGTLLDRYGVLWMLTGPKA